MKLLSQTLTFVLCPRSGVQYYDDHVCTSVCPYVCLLSLSVCLHISKTTHPTSQNFLHMLCVAVAWSSIDYNAICCVPPVL